MRALFSLDSPVMQFLSRVFDFALLNLLFLVSCIPVVTIGAASAAMYTVCFRMGTEREEGILKAYFVAFKDNFLQSTGIFLLLAAAGVLSGFAIWILLPQPGWMGKIVYLWMVSLAVAAFLYGYAFPLQSQFSNPVKQTLKNALLLSIAYLPRTVLITVINFFPLVMLFVNPVWMLRMGYLWLFFYFSLAAYGNVQLLRKVFAPYMNPESTPEEKTLPEKEDEA